MSVLVWVIMELHGPFVEAYCSNFELILFQITNQMITACKSHITNNQVETIWSLPRDEVLKKLKDSMRLNEEYQKQFHKTKVTY